jgi:hypothetical protein
MDRKNFLKCACGLSVGSCFGLNMVLNDKLSAAVKQNSESDKNTPVVPIDTRQMQNVLCYIDSSMDESVKKTIFDKLGYEHTTDPGFINWIDGYKNNLKGFFDRINSNKDTYWEKIEYNPEASTIKITGKPVDRCACPYAQNENPPKALCNYCCISFQVSMFELLLGRPVKKVDLDESYLLGGNRCSSTVYFDGKLHFE